jgi:hypothetical protein
MTKIVMSVPHSGTRSLVEFTGITGAAQAWWHFGFHDQELDTRTPIHLHIPIRDPMAVAASWARRAKHIEGLINAYQAMMAVITDAPDHITYTLYRMENLALRLGDGDGGARHPNDARPYQAAVQAQVVEPHASFFGELYP